MKYWLGEVLFTSVKGRLTYPDASVSCASNPADCRLLQLVLELDLLSHKRSAGRASPRFNEAPFGGKITGVLERHHKQHRCTDKLRGTCRRNKKGTGRVHDSVKQEDLSCAYRLAGHRARRGSPHKLEVPNNQGAYLSGLERDTEYGNSMDTRE